MKRILAMIHSVFRVKDARFITLFQCCTECGANNQFEFRIIPNIQTCIRHCWHCEDFQRMRLDPRENVVYKSLVKKLESI